MSKRSIQILLVEDNSGDATLFAKLLNELKTDEFDVRVQWVSDGEKALDYLFRQGAYSEAMSADVVILDVNLPRKNGFEVLQELRRNPGTEKIPVFMLTGSKSQEDILKAYSLGVASFITKPQTFPGLREVIMHFFAVELPLVLGDETTKKGS